MTEVIKEIKGWEGRYAISNYGKVISLLTNKEMKPSITKFGYARINLRYANSKKFKSYFIHRLVANNFLEKQSYNEVNHKDGNKLNNCVSNLEWCSREYNMKHAFKHHLNSNRGENNPRTHLVINDVKNIRSLYKEGLTRKELSIKYNVSRSTIDKIINYNTWSDN